MLGHYFIVALRNLFKFKAQNLICIIGLAVGILCFTVCLYCTRFVLSTNSCFPNHERIVELKMHNVGDGRVFAGSSALVAEQLRQLEIPQTDHITCVPYVRNLPFNVRISDEEILPYNFISIEADTVFNAVFGLDIIAGSWESAALEENSIIMSRSTAEKVFGKVGDALGKTLILAKRHYNPNTPKDGGVPYRIAAIMEDIPQNNMLNFMNHIDLLRLNDTEGLLRYSKRGGMTGTETYALLKENVLPQDLTGQLRQMSYSYRLYAKDYEMVAEKSQPREGVRLIAYIPLAIGVLILAMVLLNFFNFLVSFFYTRTREYSLRKVYGGNQAQLFLQLYVHAVLMVLLSSLVMLSLVEILGDNLRFSFSLAEIDMQFSRRMLVEHALQYLAVILVASAAICHLIARRLHRIAVSRGIVSGRKGKNFTGRNIMLWWQLFISWIFTGLVLAMVLQSNLSTVSLFPTLSKTQKKEILSIPIDYSFMSNPEKQSLVDEFVKHPGVADMMYADISLVEGYSGYSGFCWEGEKDKPWFGAGILSVPSNYFAFMNVSLIQGREPSVEGEIVVDSRFAQLRNVDVVGRNLFADSGSYTICGVSEEHRFSIYSENSDTGFLLVPRPKGEYIGHCYLKCHPGQAAQVRQWVMDILHRELPSNIEPQVRTFLDDIHQVQAIEYTLRKVFVFFAVICIIITLLGVYSCISFDTLRRQKEVALRKINGAGSQHIAWVFIRLYAILLATSAAVAFPLLHLIFGYWSQLYIHFFECGAAFWILLFASLAAAVAFTIAFKVGRTIRLNPADVIRGE
ncbi:MAG: ABC transporter permease [Bacteroidales bacterium]|nr:ABC transporter permease [Bacteroidales bacterium]